VLRRRATIQAMVVKGMALFNQTTLPRATAPLPKAILLKPTAHLLKRTHLHLVSTAVSTISLTLTRLDKLALTLLSLPIHLTRLATRLTLLPMHPTHLKTDLSLVTRLKTSTRPELSNHQLLEAIHLRTIKDSTVLPFRARLTLVSRFCDCEVSNHPSSDESLSSNWRLLWRLQHA
jgi:hypothetical protein